MRRRSARLARCSGWASTRCSSAPLDAAHPNALVAAVAAELGAAGVTPRPGVYAADSSALSAGSKYGLGSSAAVAAGLVAALTEGSAVEAEALAVAAHRRFQGGKGSGADVVAACWGGVSVVVVAPGAAVAARRLTVPGGLQVAALWTGVSASTTSRIAAFDAWRSVNPRTLDDLVAAAARGVAALEAADVPAWLASVAEYAALERTMTAGGVSVVTAEVDAAMCAAAAAGLGVRPSGAGGGDLVVAFAAADADVGRLAAAAKARGAAHLPLALAPTGALNGPPADESSRPHA